MKNASSIAFFQAKFYVETLSAGLCLTDLIDNASTVISAGECSNCQGRKAFPFRCSANRRASMFPLSLGAETKKCFDLKNNFHNEGNFQNNDRQGTNNRIFYIREVLLHYRLQHKLLKHWAANIMDVSVLDYEFYRSSETIPFGQLS